MDVDQTQETKNVPKMNVVHQKDSVVKVVIIVELDVNQNMDYVNKIIQIKIKNNNNFNNKLIIIVITIIII